jgi:hypothetical protein
MLRAERIGAVGSLGGDGGGGSNGGANDFLTLIPGADVEELDTSGSRKFTSLTAFVIKSKLESFKFLLLRELLIS